MKNSEAAQTMLEKIWSRHRVIARADGQDLMYVDSHLLQDGSAPAFAMLRQRGIKPRVPARAVATQDHYVPTDSRELSRISDPEKREMANALERDSKAAGIRFFGLDDPRQGIVHVVAPEHLRPYLVDALERGIARTLASGRGRRRAN